MGINIGQLLTSRSVINGDKIGFIRDNNKFSFSQMNQRANAFSAYLTSLNIQAGDKIAILCKNNEDVVTTFFGAAKIGVITVVLNYRLQVAELEYIIQHSDTKLIVYDIIFDQMIHSLKSKIQISYYLSHDTTPSLATIFNLSASEPLHITGGDDAILMMYTSGTTGRPKGSLLSHNNLQASSIGLSHTIDWWENDRFLMVAPFFHIGGFAPLITNVHTGATMIFMEDFHPVDAWQLIEKEKITTMMTVPTMLALLLQTYPAINSDYSTLRYISCGASAVPAALILGFRKMKIQINQVYGITEYCGAVSFWKESQHPEKYDSMGKIVMQGNLKIRDITTKDEVSQGDVGEIVISGPQVFVGYYKNNEAYQSAVQNGEFYTGDVGYLDNEGFLYVVDRLKDVIISGGENIYSSELELALSQHPAIAEVAVVGMPHEKWLEVPRAFIVLHPETELSAEAVIAFGKERLASYKSVKEVVFVKELPRNAVGKVLKTQMKNI